MPKRVKLAMKVAGARASSPYQGFLVYFAQSPLTRALTMRPGRAKRARRKP